MKEEKKKTASNIGIGLVWFLLTNNATALNALEATSRLVASMDPPGEVITLNGRVAGGVLY